MSRSYYRHRSIQSSPRGWNFGQLQSHSFAHPPQHLQAACVIHATLQSPVLDVVAISWMCCRRIQPALAAMGAVGVRCGTCCIKIYSASVVHVVVQMCVLAGVVISRGCSFQTKIDLNCIEVRIGPHDGGGKGWSKTWAGGHRAQQAPEVSFAGLALPSLSDSLSDMHQFAGKFKVRLGEFRFDFQARLKKWHWLNSNPSSIFWQFYYHPNLWLSSSQTSPWPTCLLDWKFHLWLMFLYTSAKRLAALQRDVALPRFTFITRRHHQHHLQQLLRPVSTLPSNPSR